MIRYSGSSWYTIIAWWGGINREILPSAFQYMFMLIALYYFRNFFGGINLPDSPSLGKTINAVSSLLIFMTVFRLNQCMSRHYAAVALVNDMFMHLEQLTTDFCLSIKSVPAESEAPEGTGEQDLSQKQEMEMAKAIAAKMNAIRLILAYATAVMLHFQLLDAAMDSLGVLDEAGLKHVIYLYGRLQMLLLPGERKKVDQAMSINCESPGVFRVDVNRYCLGGDCNYEQLIGMPHAYREVLPEDGVAITPIPKVVMMLLIFALQRPIDEPWGYSNRSWNLFWRRTSGIMQLMMNLESLVESPTPLPYLQHCRMLFIIFVIMIPLSINCSRPIFEHVALPLVLFWAIRGFQIMSTRLEGPMGNDEADLNLHEKIHSLEVNAEHSFDLSSDHDGELRRGLRWTEEWVATGQTNPKRVEVGQKPAHCSTWKSFRCYFKWMPIPSLMLADLVDSHGDVSVIHTLHFNFRNLFGCSDGIRRRLRRVLWRMDGQKVYQAISSNKEQGHSGIFESEADHFNSDPRYFCHYLQFVGAVNADSLLQDSNSYDAWVQRAVRLLGDQPAASLLAAMTDEDTAMSVMIKPLPPRTDSRRLMRTDSRNDSGSVRVAAMWERLS